MKAKPDISGFVPPQKDPSAFLEGGAGDREKRAKPQSRPVDSGAAKPEPTIQKMFRLRWDVANALKMGAAQASIGTGKRVTETEIVESLLRAHFKLG
jgi:hypothetical protein